MTLNLTAPKLYTYMNYRDKTRGVHAMALDYGNLILYYSYDAIVGFEVDGIRYVKSYGFHGRSTGDHIRKLEPDSTKRLTYGQFIDAFNSKVVKALT